MDIEVWANGVLEWAGGRCRCSLGPAGVTGDKREGDGATPAGTFPLRRVVFRPDRLAPPRTRLPVATLKPEDGWCDDPSDPSYNRQVKLPYPARCERLWRADHVYDLIVVLGYNDDPPVAGRGSAIFLHVARPDFAATEGCVAVARAELEAMLKRCGPESRLSVRSAPAPAGAS